MRQTKPRTLARSRRCGRNFNGRGLYLLSLNREAKLAYRKHGGAMRISIGENAKMALDTLRENKVRSFLTVLGVVIGITALITVASILVGFYSDITVYLNDYGANTVWIFKVSPGINTGRLTAEERNRKPLTL